MRTVSIAVQEDNSLYSAKEGDIVIIHGTPYIAAQIAPGEYKLISFGGNRLNDTSFRRGTDIRNVHNGVSRIVRNYHIEITEESS